MSLDILQDKYIYNKFLKDLLYLYKVGFRPYKHSNNILYTFIKKNNLCDEIIIYISNKIKRYGMCLINDNTILLIHIDKYQTLFKHIIQIQNIMSGCIKQNTGKQIIIDHGGINLFKPIHIGHFRSLLYGDVLKRTIKTFNQHVVNDIHIGDFGYHIGLIILYLKENNIDTQNINKHMIQHIYNDAYKKYDGIEKYKNIIFEILLSIQNKKKQYIEYFNIIYKIGIQYIKDALFKIDISFDLWGGEYETVISKYKYLIIKKCIKQGSLKYVDNMYVSDNVNFTRSNGTFLYPMTDLITMYYRYNVHKTKTLIYITDVRQHDHFNNIFYTFQKTFKNKTQNIFLGLGMILNNKSMPMKSRTNTQLDIQDSIDFINDNHNLGYESSISLLKIHLLQHSYHKDFIFDREKCNHNKYGTYLLYTYARIYSVLKKSVYSSKFIYNKQIEELLNIIFVYPFYIIECISNLNTCAILQYCYELCKTFNYIYEQNIKLTDYYQVIYITHQVYQMFLNILGIKTQTSI